MAIDFSNTDFEPEALDEPLVTTSLTREDEGEYSLRPKTLREYIGQEKAKGNLEVFIQAAKMRHEPLDHVLLHLLVEALVEGVAPGWLLAAHVHAHALGGGHGLGGCRVQTAAAAHRTPDGGIGLRGQTLAHDRVGKHHRAKNLFYPGQSASPFSTENTKED